MAWAPHIHIETEHYRGWPAVLFRFGEIGDEELRLRLTELWFDSLGKRDKGRHRRDRE